MLNGTVILEAYPDIGRRQHVKEPSVAHYLQLLGKKALALILDFEKFGYLILVNSADNKMSIVMANTLLEI